MDWLVVRYELTSEHSTVPPCWYRHPVAVEEFAAVMAAWQAAYHGPDSPRDDLIAWHDRWLWPCLDRLATRASWRSCIDSKQHQPTTLRAWRHDADLTTFLAADLDARQIPGEDPADDEMAALR